MRYRFKGLVRATGRPVEGHVEGLDPDEAINALSDNGIVTESLREEPKALDLSSEPHAKPQLVNAIESALDVSSVQVPFDAIANKYKGKSVWVIDRDKIRRNVAQVVDKALSEMPQSEGQLETRQRVAAAIDELFKDSRNLTSKASEANVQLERQVLRLERFIGKAESVLAAITVAARSGGFGGGGGPRRYQMQAPERKQNEVLLEIFKSNLELRGITIDEPSAPAEGEAAVPPENAEAPAEDRPQRPPVPTINENPEKQQTE